VQDRVLSARLCAGDDSALTEVFDRFGPLVLGVARRVTGDKAMAEDVLQEVFTALWCKPHHFDPERGSLRAYLGILAQRRAIDAVRATVRRRTREQMVELLDLTRSQLDEADAAVTTETVRRAIAMLPFEQRRTIELSYWQGMTHREIARALGVAEGTVKSRVRLAQVKLREALAPLAMEGV
jgi:RNA polymerase sigma factor (sigma-70 family)